MEKPGLLQPRTDEGGNPEDGARVKEDGDQLTSISHSGCEQQGIQFVPLAIESNGGWARSILRAWQVLARVVAARSGEAASID